MAFAAAVTPVVALVAAAAVTPVVALVAATAVAVDACCLQFLLMLLLL